MKKTGIFSFILALCLAVSVCVMPAYAEPVSLDPSVEYGCSTVDAKVPFLGSTEKMESVGSAILYEANSGTLMYAWNPDEPMYPASLVKIMTAMIVLREGTLTDIVTVTKEVLDSVPQNAVSAKLYTDEVITVKDLLYCMMVGSANDAAAVLADHISGSQSAFVAKMNQYAKDLGCTATEFTDVHGLDGKQKTTARDMARILSEALKDPQFQEVFGTVYYSTAPTNKMSERSLASGNYLLNDDDVKIYHDSRVTGSRTGTQDNGNRCIASAAVGNGMQMVCVVLGAKNIYADNGSTRVFGGYNETTHLLDIGFDGFQCVQLLYENQALLQTQVDNGDAYLVLGPDTNVSCVLPQGVTQDKLTYKYGNTNAIALPVKQGDHITDVQVWYGNICVAQSELYALNKVLSSQSANQNIDGTDGGSGWFVTALKVIGIFALIVLAILLGLRIYNKARYAAAQNRSRRRRRNRRRSR
jgi:D-alanyl-D-alanine carboxypeptidase (penicillin-binding protein 5/6)